MPWNTCVRTPKCTSPRGPGWEHAGVRSRRRYSDSFQALGLCPSFRRLVDRGERGRLDRKGSWFIRADYFKEIIPFPEAGQNAMHSGILF